LNLAAVSVDCDDARLVAEFWAAALGRRVDPGASPEFASIGMPEHRDVAGWRLPLGDGPTWLFAKVPESKTAKNRMHFDLAATDPAAEVARLIDLGAVHVSDVEEWGYRWSVLHGPEGNEFCIAQQL
jgi:hypothetical protein